MSNQYNDYFNCINVDNVVVDASHDDGGGRRIQVCGYPVVDWMILLDKKYVARGNAYTYRHKGTGGVNLCSQVGGAALIESLLKDILVEMGYPVQSVGSVELSHFRQEEPQESPQEHIIDSTWTTWLNYEDSAGLHYRISEWNQDQSTDPYLLLLEDSVLDMSGTHEVGVNSAASQTKHILLQLSEYAEGQKDDLVIDLINSGLARVTTVLTSISDLRACSEKIGASLSWEKLFEEVTAAVRGNNVPFLEPASKQLAFARVIVTIGVSGAVIVEPDRDTLIFDRTGQEGDFNRIYQGQMLGYNACMLSALATEWYVNPERSDWMQAVKLGMGLSRLLHVTGYKNEQQNLHFPSGELAKAYRECYSGGKLGGIGTVWDLGVYVDTEGYAKSLKQRGKWSILEGFLRQCCVPCDPTAASYREIVLERASRIVIHGPQDVNALPDVPVEIVGSWLSADRQEIEGVRNVNNAFHNYLEQGPTGKPLCVAVFGPPGSGKSFAIKQIALGMGFSENEQLTFNLSQFDAPEELLVAFHQIRDLHVKGKMPLVFWDEFDTPCQGQRLGWLRYFLAPMQDGEFLDRGRVHPIGGGIYVFAGATSYTFDEFCAGNDVADQAAKKPDFISRLKASIDVLGPNRKLNSDEDSLYIIRRAFLLNAYLNAGAGHLKKNDQFQLDKGVLNAFLTVGRYRHGARSLETLVKMSQLADKNKFELSSLPPDQILKMHVNANEFNKLTRLNLLRIGVVGQTDLGRQSGAELNQPVGHGFSEDVWQAVNLIKASYSPKVPGDNFFMVLTTLEAGPVRAVVRLLLQEENTQLIAVLPVPQKEYLLDFGPTDDYQADYRSAELRQEFRYLLVNRTSEVVEMPPLATRAEAYCKANEFICLHSDVILTLGDQEEQGPGWPADIIRTARELGKPVYRIRT